MSETPPVVQKSGEGGDERARDRKAARGVLLLGVAVVVALVILQFREGKEITGSGLNPIPEGARAEPKPKLQFADMMQEVDRLEAAGSFAAARAELQRAAREYPDSVSVEEIAPRIATLDSLDQVRVAEERAFAERQRLAVKWSYPKSTDPMTGGTVKQALILSENTIDLDFPYQGPQRATLALRSHPSHGQDVILGIEKGQLLCRSYSGCRVRVRFDEGDARNWTGAEPRDNTTTLLFIRGYSNFLQQLRKSQVIRIQAEIYQSGAPIFEFHVGGFDYDRYASP